MLLVSRSAFRPRMPSAGPKPPLRLCQASTERKVEHRGGARDSYDFCLGIKGAEAQAEAEEDWGSGEAEKV
ncbi:hypothetical protein FMEXI_865 [Fusarium mexicanum]|uniref:Uncharacterized protein n=1 Tax=Fusarium mexicanum TaxID=751941 RepID=A0A8H5JLS4_9HYPO|nr:hypothetical protein FMEXI_865 [Fusarium mexicanum]